MADRTYKQSDGQTVRLQEVAAGEYAPEVYVRDAWSAGVALGTPGPTIGLAGGSRLALQLGVLLFPGESFGFNNLFAGAADFAGSVYVVEEDL